MAFFRVVQTMPDGREVVIAQGETDDPETAGAAEIERADVGDEQVVIQSAETIDWVDV